VGDQLPEGGHISILAHADLGVRKPHFTDGYHRSFGLLNRGISRVPAIFRHAENFEDLGVPHGMLPQAQWLGTRPPRLDDYLVDEVAETVNVPAAQRLIVVQALESTLNG
jgi:hypothetical protein